MEILSFVFTVIAAILTARSFFYDFWSKAISLQAEIVINELTVLETERSPAGVKYALIASSTFAGVIAFLHTLEVTLRFVKIIPPAMTVDGAGGKRSLTPAKSALFFSIGRCIYTMWTLQWRTAELPIPLEVRSLDPSLSCLSPLLYL